MSQREGTVEEPSAPTIRAFEPGALAAEARLVGLREFHTPTLEAVERRRMQLWFLSIVILLGVTMIVTAGSLFPDSLGEIGVREAWFTGGQFRGLVLGLTCCFAVYVFDKERHLRRLTRLLVDERVLTAALSNRLTELNALLDAGKAINAVLELDAVLDVILRSATTLLGASGGSILLADDEARLLTATCVHGNDAARGAVVAYGEGIAGRVAVNWEPLLVSGSTAARTAPTPSAMSVPLVHRGRFLGVLNLNAAGERRFTEYDLRALSLFAEQAASAIANSRLYEIERRHVAELIESEMRKSQFLAAVSHDLRTPLTSLTGCTKLLQRDDLTAAQRGELTSMIERQAGRLTAMVESLLTAARIEAEEAPQAEPVDLVAIARELAGEYAVDGRPFTLDAPATAVVLGRADGLRRVLVNLLDNAFKHGKPPVSVTIGASAGEVAVGVRDLGVGIPSEDRARVFERFTRLDANRQIPGVGLGLSIVQGIVSGYGGRVWIDDPTDDGGGVVVWVGLQPADQPPATSR